MYRSKVHVSVIKPDSAINMRLAFSCIRDAQEFIEALMKSLNKVDCKLLVEYSNGKSEKGSSESEA